jgi:hypothetical protein
MANAARQISTPSNNRREVTTTPAKKFPTPAEINAQQRRDAEAAHRRQAPERPGTAVMPAVKPGIPVAAAPDNRTSAQRYLDEVAPASIVGRMSKFSKDGLFITRDDGKPMSNTAPYVALCDQTLVGRMKFNGNGERPDRHMGLLYDGFVPPARETLGDTDESKWEIGLDGQPADPWQHHIYLVLQNTETQELFTFVTSSKTGRRAVGNLLKHYDRVSKTDASFYPLVNLEVGGFKHSDPRVGWVATPVFAVVGRIPRADAAKPETLSRHDELNDDIPY